MSLASHPPSAAPRAPFLLPMVSRPAAHVVHEPSPAEELARRALDKLSAMVAYWDSSLRCRSVNRACESWFGIKPEAMVGKHVSDLLGPLYRFNLPYLQGALRGEAQQFERDLPDPRGGPARHSLVNYFPDVVEGEVRGFFALVTDISVIKETELELRETEERFRLTLDEAPIGMALVSAEGRFIRVNRALCEILGYTGEELLALTFQAITHPEDLEADLTLATRLGSGQIPRYTLEKRYIRKDGSIVDCELNGSALRGPDGQLVHFIAQVEDITLRKRAEREQQFLAELGPVLASTLDQEEILERVLRIATRRIADFCIVDVTVDGQVRRKEVASRDPAKHALTDAVLNLPLDHTRPYLLSEAIRTRKPVLMQRPSDDELTAMAQSPEHLRLLKALEIVSMIAVPLLAGERLVGAIALIASRGSRAYDDRDLRLARDLAWRAAMALENARLYAAAREATKVRDEVLSIVAHDLRNPLSTISMQATLLRRRAQPRAGSEATSGEVIQRSAARMTRLIEDLLDVSRMEGGSLSVNPAPMELRAFFSERVESQRPLAVAAGIELRLQAPQEETWLRADRDRLTQVLENLFGNALKFTRNGGSITIGAQARDSHVLFWVRDTGLGMQPEHLPHVFDRFWQARRTERQGAGLGLPIAKGVVEAHGGRIWVESKPGEGTCFWFEIPAGDCNPQGVCGDVTARQTI